MGTRCGVVQNCRHTRENNFLRLSDSATDFLSKLKIFTGTILSQNYHWTDGFFLKNHPLKEAEKQPKFCFRIKEDTGVGSGVRCAGQGQFRRVKILMQL